MSNISWRRVRAIARRDIASILRNKGILLPLIMAPTVILVVLPTLLVTGGGALGAGAPEAAIQAAPTGLEAVATAESAEAATGLTGAAAWPAFVLGVFIAPLYMLIPLMVATVIAADSFAGELDRGTLEALLNTPTSDRELFLGKFLSAWLPAMVVSIGGFVVYAVLANVLAWPAIGRVFFPTPEWWVLALAATPALGALALGAMVIVSSRVTSVQSAQQFGSLVVLPVIALLIAQVTGGVSFNLRSVSVMAVGVWIAALVLLRVSVARFNRNRLAERL